MGVIVHRGQHKDWPHVAINSRDGNAHVISVETLKGWIDGSVSWSGTWGWGRIVRAIIAEWLDGLEESAARKDGYVTRADKARADLRIMRSDCDSKDEKGA